MDLEIKDVAELLNVSEVTVEKWLSDGKIPAYQINDKFRFSRIEIEDWVMKRKHKQADGTSPFNNEKEQKGGNQFSLFRAIHNGDVLTNIPGSTKEEIISATMNRVAEKLDLDAEVICDLLFDRERLQPTALGHGIAVPHTRDFLLSHDAVTVVFPESPIDYGALDGAPVHTLFFLFGSDDKRHLHLLAKIAYLSNQPETREFFQTRPTKEALLEKIKKWEARF